MENRRWSEHARAPSHGNSEPFSIKFHLFFAAEPFIIPSPVRARLNKTFMHFNEALRYLLSLGHETLAIKLGLRNIELLLSALGNPERSYPAVQIAGTNGKGSTAVILDSICHEAGIKTGLYTSPHLISITERIRIGGREISPELFARHATKVREAAERLLAGEITALPTFFEQVTAIALLAFRDEQVELGILETGLGGRLDATSAAGATVVAITPIAFDHEEYLGQTLESIAAEKAAIIRPGSTAIISAQTPQALEVIRRQCDLVGVEPEGDECKAHVESATADGRLCVTLETSEDRYENITLGLRGRHQVENTAVAIRLAESLRERGFGIPRTAIVAGVANAVHPGRLEIWEGKPDFLFDGAHNPAGAQALRDYLNEFVQTPVTFVFGAMRDKKLEQMAALLFPVASRVVLTTLDNPRSASMGTLQSIASGFIGPEKTFAASSVTDAIRIALEITPTDGLICVTGSLYLIGEVQAAAKQTAQAEAAS